MNLHALRHKTIKGLGRNFSWGRCLTAAYCSFHLSLKHLVLATLGDRSLLNGPDTDLILYHKSYI